MPKQLSEFLYEVSFAVYATDESSAKNKLNKKIKATKDIQAWGVTLEEITTPGELKERAHLGCANYPNCDDFGCGEY